jgi:predicted membrane-bound mannosyltransferase
MNPNDLVAQQQSYMNQMMQNAQHTQWALLALWAASMLISFGVIYLFYARLRDIADELRKLRIAYEMAEDRKARAATSAPPRADDDSRYLPKS